MENVECLQLWTSIAYPFLSIFEVNCYELYPVTDATTGWLMHVCQKRLTKHLMFVLSHLLLQIGKTESRLN